MQITLNLPHVFYPGSSPKDNARVLRALLDCMVNINQAYLKDHSALGLYQSGVVYGRTKIWETIPALYQRGFGDCKSLTAALIAEYRNRGIEADPVFRFDYSKKRPGQINYHILVQTKYGFKDPSKDLGMGVDENAYFNTNDINGAR